MEDSDQLLFKVYERALEHLRAFDARIAEQFDRLISANATVGARDLAFLEGLRKERDEALAALQDAESAVFNYLLSHLGLSSSAAD